MFNEPTNALTVVDAGLPGADPVDGGDADRAVRAGLTGREPDCEG